MKKIRKELDSVGNDRSPAELKLLEKKQKNKLLPKSVQSMDAFSIFDAIKTKNHLSRIISNYKKRRKKKAKWLYYKIRKFDSLAVNNVILKTKTVAKHELYHIQLKPEALRDLKTYFHSPDTSDGTIIDSGARVSVSRIENDFDQLYSDRKVRVAGIGGKLPACWGKLKPSRLIPEDSPHREAVFCADLPVPRLFSTSTLNENGWDVTLSGNGKQHFIYHPDRNDYIGLVTNPDGSASIPSGHRVLLHWDTDCG